MKFTPPSPGGGVEPAKDSTWFRAKRNKLWIHSLSIQSQTQSNLIYFTPDTLSFQAYFLFLSKLFWTENKQTKPNKT